MSARQELVLVALLVGACNGRPPHPDAAPTSAVSAATDTLAGRVETFGVDPMVYPVLRTPAGRVRLEGPLAEELRRVSGASVRAWGSRASGQPEDRLTVAGYAVDSVNGRPVYVGVVFQTPDGLVLRDAREWRLAGAPGALRALIGGKIYVAGSLSGDTITVESWGVIRQP
jgi:hypothetical protein